MAENKTVRETSEQYVGKENPTTTLAGVQKIQMISQTWTKKDILIAFAG
jgi:hypothetical protein